MLALQLGAPDDPVAALADVAPSLTPVRLQEVETRLPGGVPVTWILDRAGGVRRAHGGFRKADVPELERLVGELVRAERAPIGGG